VSPPDPLGNRMPVPGGQGCAAVKDRLDCCRFVDGRPSSPHAGQICVPARHGALFYSSEEQDTVVCQPSCWISGTCGSGTNQSDRAGFCEAQAVARLPSAATAEQGGARIAAGGTVRFYVVGSSNAAWQNWPDQMHMMLERLGYVVDLPRTQIPGEIIGPFGRRTPKCADAQAYEPLSTPRLGMQGWSSWGFSYENATCETGDGYRDIVGWNVSCTNGWACNPLWRGPVPSIPLSSIAKGVSGSDVVVLSNFVNDGRNALYAPHGCFGGPAIPDFMNTTGITVDSLLRTIRAIHAEDPGVVVLVLARYYDALPDLQVDSKSISQIDDLNAAIREGIAGEPNTYWVDSVFPTGVVVFQSLNSGHANCRGDKIMAANVIEAMFQRKVLSTGFDLGNETCLAAADCSALGLPCCQRSASCYVDRSGVCAPYGPGLQ